MVFSLDDKRTKIGDGTGDLPDVQAKYLSWCEGRSDFTDRTTRAFEVAIADIREQRYDLSINRYRVQVHTEEDHDDPREILKQLKETEAEILKEIGELEGLLGS